MIIGANEQKRHVVVVLLPDDTDSARSSSLTISWYVSEWESSVLDSMVRSNSSTTLLHRRQWTRGVLKLMTWLG